jgi:hypothetical protein
MIKIGDKVVPYFNMAQEGVVTEIKRTPSKQWSIGGTMTSRATVVVLLDKTQVLTEFKLDDLRLVD